MDYQDKIEALQHKLNHLLKQQNDFQREINKLQIQINQFKTDNNQSEQKDDAKLQPESKPVTIKRTQWAEKTSIKESSVSTSQKKRITQPKPIEKKSDLEKLIGESIINKIGIVILIIGVGIGAKYSIENNLISPLTRIVLGYLAGLGLIAVGIKLKRNYLNYSAVLVSGAMTIMYFITFFAYSIYNLIPQLMAFGLMLVFTVFTVIASLTYNKQIIAHLGLVGAYAVPFLLSDGSNQVTVLFTYVSIINIGVLFISFKRYWKSLFYSAFFLTWVIYALWYFIDYEASKQFVISLVFLSVFFFIFYATFLAYKLIKKEQYQADDILLLMLNSFIFFGLGYMILDNNETGNQLLGVFTLANAIVHFGVSLLIYKHKLADRTLFLMIVGLVLIFITAAIPIQLDGRWVSLLWALETALLFWVGRTQKASIYEVSSYILMILAFFSLIDDWTVVYSFYDPGQPETRITPIFNVNFLISAIFMGAFGFVTWLFFNKKHTSEVGKGLLDVAVIIIPTVFLVTTYLSFIVEIFNYWDQLYIDSKTNINEFGYSIGNSDLIKFRSIWVINYSLLFFSILALVNIKKLKDKLLANVNFILILIALLLFLGQGLMILSELRENYLYQPSEYFISSFSNIWIRYLSIAFVAFTLMILYKYKNQDFIKKDYTKTYDIVLHITSLWVASSELLHWLDIYSYGDNYKLGLSILCGLYAVFLIILGIWQRKKHLRISAIVLFGLTLIKLFLYDIASLNTISKTIIFVSLGVLLLVISFLYNKFKQKIFGDDEV